MSSLKLGPYFYILVYRGLGRTAEVLDGTLDVWWIEFCCGQQCPLGTEPRAGVSHNLEKDPQNWSSAALGLCGFRQINLPVDFSPCAR